MLSIAEVTNYNTRQQSDSDSSLCRSLISSQYYVDDEEEFPPLSTSSASSLKSVTQNINKTSRVVLKNTDASQSTFSGDSSSSSSIIWIGSRTFAEATSNKSRDDNPIVTSGQYAKKKIFSRQAVNGSSLSLSTAVVNSELNIKRQSNCRNNIHHDVPDNNNDNDLHHYYHIKSIQFKKRHVSKKIECRKTKTLKLAYQRCIAAFFTHHPHNNDKLRSLYHHYQDSLNRAQEDLKISKELKDRLPPRWYFTSRSGHKIAQFTHINQHGILDTKNIHEKKFMQEQNHSEQIKQELKNPQIRQLFFDLTDLAVKKLYWMTYCNYPEAWKNEAEYFKRQLFGIHYVLASSWIPYLETELIPDIEERWKKEQRKWIQRLIRALPASSSRTRRLYIEYGDDRIVKINCLSLYNYYVKTNNKTKLFTV